MKACEEQGQQDLLSEGLLHCKRWNIFETGCLVDIHQKKMAQRKFAGDCALLIRTAGKQKRLDIAYWITKIIWCNGAYDLAILRIRNRAYSSTDEIPGNFEHF